MADAKDTKADYVCLLSPEKEPANVSSEHSSLLETSQTFHTGNIRSDKEKSMETKESNLRKKSRIRETKKRHKESPIQDFRHPSKMK